MVYYFKSKCCWSNQLIVMCCSSIFLLLCLWWICVGKFSQDAVFSYGLSKRLFPQDTVLDINNGSIAALFSYVRMHEATMVYYYAPWCGQCSKAVPSIIDVHHKLTHPKIAVVAINCWVGKCREVFPTISFPRMFLYHTNHEPVEYLSDLQSAKILHFIYLSIRPLTYIGDENQLANFLHLNDNIVVCYMDPKKLQEDNRFKVLFETSLSLINKDVKQQIGLILNPDVALLLNLKQHGQLVSRTLFHNDLYYPETLTYTAGSILDWLAKQNKQVVTPLSNKPLNLKFYVEQLKKGPVMMLIHTPSEISTPALNVYHESASSYYSCGCKKPQCLMYLNDLCTSYVPSPTVTCTICQLCAERCLCQDETQTFANHKNRDSLLTSAHSKGLTCHSFLYSSYYYMEQFSVCCHKEDHRRQQTSLEKITDGISVMQKDLEKEKTIFTRSSSLKNIANTLLKHIHHLKHNRTTTLESINPITDRTFKSQKVVKQFQSSSKCGQNAPCCFDVNNAHNIKDLSYTGLACHTNRTLSFHTMEYEENSYILKHIGVAEKLPSLIIIDAKAEENFILDANVTKRNIENFVLLFTRGELNRTYLSAQAKSVDTSSHVESAVENRVLIKELRSLTFKESIHNTQQISFVMFYTKWCGVCKVVNLHFLTLARLYQNESITFARIDGDVNDLPWEFVPNFYPSFILFPASRKEDSVAFPDDIEITLDNLISFLKHNL